MRPIRTPKVAPHAAALFESLGHLLSSHRAVTRVSLAALSFTFLIAITQQAPAAQAGPEAIPTPLQSLLPRSLGAAVETDSAITIPFDSSMDIDSVNASIQVLPEQRVELAWNAGRTALTIQPEHLWRADEQYLVVIGGQSAHADGSALLSGQRYSFTTEAPPSVAEFQVHLATEIAAAEVPTATGLSTRSVTFEADTEAADALRVDAEPIGKGATTQSPTRTAKQVSASSSISVGFSEEMDHADVEANFVISPAVAGDLTWKGTNLVFTPTGRLEAGTRYTISLLGAHDRSGNALGGEATFSFIVQPGAQLTKASPKLGARDANPEVVEMWFSQPMDVEATNAAFSLVDADGDVPKAGTLKWNEAGTQVTWVPDAPFSTGRVYSIILAEGAQDADGNSVTTRWSFATIPPPDAVSVPAGRPAGPARATTSTRSAPAIPPPGPASSLAGYALNQVNAARAAYGFAPLVLDAGVSAVAAAHAWDQARNGYFSHYGLDGSTKETRLARGGVSFGWAGENQCYHVGMSQQATLNWCHAQFMAEPWPGHWNHIGNILNASARRMGVGIATVGGRTVITWNFTN